MCKKRGTNCDRRRKWKWQINTFEPFGGILPATKRNNKIVWSSCGIDGYTRYSGFKYDIPKGKYLIYVKGYARKEIVDRKARIAVISQRPYLFQGTIEENVNIDGKASRDAVVEACRKSGALGFIEKLDHGFGQKIGQDGAKLSGGERQKIAVARALLKNADILLMDEATEGFDVESNEALRELLHSELKNKTIVFITHKYKELESVDKVYRLSKGILELVRS